MTILAIRTDSAYASLVVLRDDKAIAEKHWEAGRSLAASLLKEIDMLLLSAGGSVRDIAGLIVYEGPGSFTGLRIGVTIANTIAYALSVPIIATSGEEWINTGIARLLSGNNDRLVNPHYGSDAHITL